MLDAAFGALVHKLFFNTGPTGQHVMQVVGDRLDKPVATAIDPDTLARASRSAKPSPPISTLVG